MAQEKLTKKRRNPKRSEGKHGAGGKVELTELQKVLIVNGGMAHHLRRGQTRRPAEMTKEGRRRLAEAKISADREAIEKRKKESGIKGSVLVSSGR